MDFVSSSDGRRVFYTQKELKLHVSGPSGICALPGRSFPADVATSVTKCEAEEEALGFYRNGYFCAPSAVDINLIEAARVYVNDQYERWLRMNKRQDDWRCHLLLDLTKPDIPIEHPEIMNLLLGSPHILGRIRWLTGSDISGIFYTQIAFRTPVNKNLPNLAPKHATETPLNQSSDTSTPVVVAPHSTTSSLYSPGAEYHLDGQANRSGTRFPDPWTLLVGVALVDVSVKDMGAFTVFPGFHTGRNWSNYPAEKRTKTLPDLGEPTFVTLRAGDAVFAHVLLPHRGGRNTLGAYNAVSTTSIPTSADTGPVGQRLESRDAAILPAARSPPRACNPHTTTTTMTTTVMTNENRGTCEGKQRHEEQQVPWKIPFNTREMVFFRVRVSSVDYEDDLRPTRVLTDPWAEFPFIKSLILGPSLSASPSSTIISTLPP